MGRVIQFSVVLITIFVMSIISCNMPSDPFKKPSNSKARLFLEENEQTIDFGSEVKIGVSIFLAEHIEALHIKTRNNGLDTVHPYSSNAVDDTLYFCHKFNVEGKDTIFVTGILKDKKYMNKTDTLPVFILPAPDSICFDSIAESVHTVAGKVDTLVFIASARSEKPLSFSVKSNPGLDSKEISVKKIEDTAKVILSTDDSGEYTVTLYAQRDTLIDSAVVNVTVYEPLIFENVILPDIVTSGKNDTLVFMLPTEREDTLTCKLLNQGDFSRSEISILSETADSFVVVFTPETKGQRKFNMLITNGHIKDTLNYEVFVSEKIPVWNITEKTIDAVEGEEISVDLRDLINESFSGDFSLDSDFGEIEDTVWQWTPPWGSDTTKTAVISAVCDSDVYKLKLIISVAEGDTTGPAITLLHSSMGDTLIGSSQIYVEAVVKDFGAGVSSVQIIYGLNSANMASSEDSIYIGPVRDLKNGEKTEIKIVAKDGSMQKNVTDHVFYVTYDSTIGDNVAPVISQESGPEDGSRVTDGQVQLSFSVTDDSDIDSVYWTLDGTFKGVLAKDDSIYSLNGTLDEYGSNEIEIIAVDKSLNRNSNSLKLVFDYNTEITAIEIISPEDDASDVDTDSITFKWSGGNDEDGDTVFFELLYGTSKSNLNKKITGINCSTLDLTELKLYTEYYWQVIAYSKEYPDTARSSICSFKTKAVPPEITTHPEKNIDVDIGDSVVLKVSATGNPAPSYRWLKDGEVIKDGGEDTLVVVADELTDSGGYTVEVYNDGGKVISNKADLRVIYPVKVSAGGQHSLILKNDGSLFACGNNFYGQLGNLSQNGNSIYQPEMFMDDVGNILGTGLSSFISKSNGDLIFCGFTANTYLSSLAMYVYEPFKIAENVKGVGLINSDIFFLKDNGDLLKCGLDYDSTNSEKIMSDVQYISGYGHILILKDNGDLFAYGDNSHGQLGIDTADFVNEPVQIEYNVKSISTGAYHSLILKNDGTLYACGNNEYGQLGTYSYDNCSFLAEITNNVKGIAAGGNHSLMLKNDGSLYACGDNRHGQLGVNLPVKSDQHIKIINSNVVSIAAGDNHSFAILDNGYLYSWGNNEFYQLGDGTTDNRNSPVCIIPEPGNP